MSSLMYNLRARRIRTAAISAHIRQSRVSFASARVERATGSRKPMPYSFEGCAPRHASMSRRLSRYVICANAMTRNCSLHRNFRTPRSPPYRATIRSKLVHGTKSITCANSVRPTFTVKPPDPHERENYIQIIKPASNRHQAYLGATHCLENEIPQIQRIEPDDDGYFLERNDKIRPYCMFIAGTERALIKRGVED